jgi:hypothetical protein
VPFAWPREMLGMLRPRRRRGSRPLSPLPALLKACSPPARLLIASVILKTHPAKQRPAYCRPTPLREMASPFMVGAPPASSSKEAHAAADLQAVSAHAVERSSPSSSSEMVSPFLPRRCWVPPAGAETPPPRWSGIPARPPAQPWRVSRGTRGAPARRPGPPCAFSSAGAPGRLRPPRPRLTPFDPLLLSPQEAPVCWICLDYSSPLIYPCKCPRTAHPRCLARWQLQSAGSRRETHCEFCDAALPDWRSALTPQCGACAPAVMNVNFDGRTYSFEVRPGPDGYRLFTESIRRAFSLPADAELNITFTCDEPAPGRSGVGWGPRAAGLRDALGCGGRPCLPLRSVA